MNYRRITILTVSTIDKVINSQIHNLYNKNLNMGNYSTQIKARDMPINKKNLLLKLTMFIMGGYITYNILCHVICENIKINHRLDIHCLYMYYEINDLKDENNELKKRCERLEHIVENIVEK